MNLFCIVHRYRDIRLLIDGDQQVLLLQILRMNYDTSVHNSMGQSLCFSFLNLVRNILV